MPRVTRADCLFAFVLLMMVLGTRPALAQVTINEARQQGAESSVTVEGTVTRAYNDFVRLQDDTGPTGASALVVRQSSGAFHDDVQDGTISRGASIQVSGTLSEFNGLLQINGEDLSSHSVEGNPGVPEPQDVTLSDIRTNGEDYESELVRITGIQFQDASGAFDNQTSYTVMKGRETLTYRVQGTDETNFGGRPIPSGQFDYEGVTGEFQGEYQLLPIRSTTTTFRFGRLYATVQEGGNAVSAAVRAVNVGDGEQVSVTAAVGAGSTAKNGTDVTRFDSPQTLTFSGSDPAPQVLSLDPVDDTRQEGVERLEVTLQSDDGIVAVPQTFTLWLLDDATAQGPVAKGETGNSLIDQLQQTYGDPSTLGYDVARDTMFAVVYGAQDDSLRSVYTGFAKYIPADADPTAAACNDKPGSCTDPNDINTEHTWPQSLGAREEPARSNMHILFPARADVNTARSNNPYGEISDSETDEWFVQDQSRTDPPPEADRPRWSETISTQFEPRHHVKGDVARAMFYFRTIYPNRASDSFYDPQRETLLDWHQADPVDAAEMRRNIRQASYQDNKLNPFVVDPSLVDRAYGSGADAGSPTNLTADFGEDAVSLSWTESTGVAEGYHVYRSPTAFSQPSEATRLTDSPVSETEYTDTAGKLGDRHVYAVTAVEPDGEKTALSNRVTGVFYPNTVSVTVDRSFGDPSTGDSYRLVALPGQVDRSLASTLSGEAGVGWQAYWDDGSDQTPFLKFDGSDQFDLRPGRGFWVLSDSSWQVDLSLETVSLSDDGKTAISLHEGWNIISNPLPVDVPWGEVEEENEGPLQILWTWTGSGFEPSSTFASAADGEAYYFLNDQGLDQLTVPVPPADGATKTASQEREMKRAVELVARRKGEALAQVRVGEYPAAADGKDHQDVIAPPSRFADVSFSAQSPFADAAERRGRLAQEARPPGTPGQTYTLKLRADSTGPVTLRAASLPESPEVDAALLDPATGRPHDLRVDGPMTLMVGPDPSRVQLLVGRSSYVASEIGERLPDALTVEAPVPNPFLEQITLEYTLPEAQDVTVAAFDLLGRRVRTLAEGRQEAGSHRVTWTGTDASQRALASGTYFLRVSTDNKQHVEKVVLVR
ncbi:endonuclease [Salinibacter altiplanensis]|uniref:endonuclease n=1 Tax=Salinibacter altiplanensis TaxID=1803181 RepID=UPI001F1A6859|nr:endonuclease [Salinibacter altiplanensis]